MKLVPAPCMYCFAYASQKPNNAVRRHSSEIMRHGPPAFQHRALALLFCMVRGSYSPRNRASISATISAFPA